MHKAYLPDNSSDGKITDYERGWQDAHKAIADYVEQEVCIVTAEMIRRMKDEQWRKGNETDEQ